jgi:hypothetical protein
MIERERRALQRALHSLTAETYFDDSDIGQAAHILDRLDRLEARPARQWPGRCQQFRCAQEATHVITLERLDGPFEVVVCWDHAKARRPRVLSYCEGCGEMLLGYQFEKRCQLNRGDAEELNVAVGDYHEECCPKCALEAQAETVVSWEESVRLSKQIAARKRASEATEP